MNFWPIFILFFLFFFQKTFLFFRNLKKQLQIMEDNFYTYSMVFSDLSYPIKWRAGGAPSPPGYQVS